MATCSGLNILCISVVLEIGIWVCALTTEVKEKVTRVTKAETRLKKMFNLLLPRTNMLRGSDVFYKWISVTLNSYKLRRKKKSHFHGFPLTTEI